MRRPWRRRIRLRWPGLCGAAWPPFHRSTRRSDRYRSTSACREGRPKVAENFRYFENVAFLTGDSSAILPSLLAELNRADMPPEFVLIDGDHSAEGIKRDVGCLLDYTPKRPLFVVLHDSFNPGCRRGMLEAGWERSPYLQWIDLDFIPGRIVEHGGSSSGQMWGGLALAYFTPARRCGDLPLRQSGRRLFEAAKAVASNGKH